MEAALYVLDQLLNVLLCGVDCPDGSCFSVELEVGSEFFEIFVSETGFAVSDVTKEFENYEYYSESGFYFKSISICSLLKSRSSYIVYCRVFPISLLSHFIRIKRILNILLNRLCWSNIEFLLQFLSLVLKILVKQIWFFRSKINSSVLGRKIS